MRDDLIERLRVIAQWLDQRAHFESEPETKASHSEDADTCRQAAAALEAAQKLDRLAAAGTVEGFLSLPDDAKRRWFAAHLVESSRRKKAEEALEEARDDAARYRWLKANDNAHLLAEDVIDDQIAIDQARGKGVADEA